MKIKFLFLATAQFIFFLNFKNKHLKFCPIIIFVEKFLFEICILENSKIETRR